MIINPHPAEKLLSNMKIYMAYMGICMFVGLAILVTGDLAWNTYLHGALTFYLLWAIL